jgi:hypothetical protein
MSETFGKNNYERYRERIPGSSCDHAVGLTGPRLESRRVR